ncbi:purine nucleoside phosphorylase-like, partial [Passer montanus]|uniref:purine nucleoside phosphorylase-like n=1 Tax=Passer montanus TaxID=9160 RepID=UPI001961E15C
MWVYDDPNWSVLVHTGSYWSLLSPSYEACAEAARWLRARLIPVHTGPYWFISLCMGLYGFIWVYTGSYWSVLVHTGSYWSLLSPSYEACAEAARWLRARLREAPRVALVCGSGLGALAQELRDPQSLEYRDIPHFPRSTVQGHAGRLVVGRLGSTPCAVLQGRFHLYEGYSPAQVVIPVRTLALLGVHTLVLTNAAGSLRPGLTAGHLLVIRDHIDLPGLAGRSALVGPNDDRWAL